MSRNAVHHGFRASVILGLFGLFTLMLPARVSAQMMIEVAMYADMDVDLDTATAMFYVGLADMTDTQGATHSSYYTDSTVTVCSSQASDGISDWGMGGYMEVPFDPEIDDCFSLAASLSAWCSYVGPVGGNAEPMMAHSEAFNLWYNWLEEHDNHHDYYVHESSVDRACAVEKIWFPNEVLGGLTMRGTFSGFYVHTCKRRCYLGHQGLVGGSYTGVTTGNHAFCPAAVQ